MTGFLASGRDMGAAYEPYEPAPTGFDASRFPDRSGEGPMFQYGASMFTPTPAGADPTRFPDRCVFVKIHELGTFQMCKSGCWGWLLALLCSRSCWLGYALVRGLCCCVWLRSALVCASMRDIAMLG